MGRDSSISFLPDGRRLALAENLNPRPGQRTEAKEYKPKFLIRVVDLSTGESSAPLSGHQGKVIVSPFLPMANLSPRAAATPPPCSGMLPHLPCQKDPPPSADQFAAFWTDMGGDARRAYRSMWTLADAPGTIDLFREELRPASAAAVNELQVLRAIEVLERIKTPPPRSC